MATTTVRKCPYECPDFYRLGSCEHEQKIRVRQPKSPSVTNKPRSTSSASGANNSNKRRGSLPGVIWPSFLSNNGSHHSSGSVTSANKAHRTPSTSPPVASIPQRPCADSPVTTTSTSSSDAASIEGFVHARTSDELVDVHFELMLRELAVPEKTQKTLIRQQSAEQKRRLLRLHMLSHRENAAEAPTRIDWVDRFASLRASALIPDDISSLLVGIRTAHRTSLERFFSSGSLEKLAEAAHEIALVQTERSLKEAQLLRSILGCFEYLSRTELGLGNLVESEDATLILVLSSRIVRVAFNDGEQVDEATCVGLTLDIVVKALVLLIKIGFSREQGASRVLTAMDQSAAVRRERGVTMLYSWARLLSKGALTGESTQVREKLAIVDLDTRLSVLRFLNALVEMPFTSRASRDSIIRDLKDLDVVSSAKKALIDIEQRGGSLGVAGDMRTQVELLAALLSDTSEPHDEQQRLKEEATQVAAVEVNGNVPPNRIPTPLLQSTEESTICAIPSAALSVHGVIGSGSFGTVHLGTFRGAKVAIKCLHRRPSAVPTSSTRAVADAVLREAQVLGRAQNHPNIVRFFGVSLEKDEVRLVFEFCELGSLEDVIVRSGETSDLETVARFGAQTAAGLAHLHALGVIHRDVAARNVLVDARGVCKVSDFGMARMRSIASSSSQTTNNNNHNSFSFSSSLGGKTTSSSNPLKWAAPESLRDRVFSRASDAWMFGIFLWELWYQSVPFPHLDHFAAGCKVAFENLSPHVDDARGRQAPALMAICVRCWQPDPKQRPTMETIMVQLEDIQHSCLGVPINQSTTTAVRRFSPRPPAPVLPQQSISYEPFLSVAPKTTAATTLDQQPRVTDGYTDWR